ncbi:MAG: type II toxin-antitoxin system RelE/ParE family toxin [Nitrosospira multiformis]|nr:type II toxin-antitoxin system RelE/ParE family toxin [Nitrosospira multiformis]
MYADWFTRLHDIQAKARINARLRRAELGNFGDCKLIGGGVLEMRIHYGPGYRLYLTRRGQQTFILLAGGDKSTQMQDIKVALQLADELKGTI